MLYVFFSFDSFAIYFFKNLTYISWIFLLHLNIACSLGNKLHTKLWQEVWVEGIIRPSITLGARNFSWAISGFHGFVRPWNIAPRERKNLWYPVYFSTIFYSTIKRDTIQYVVIINTKQ